MEEMIFENVGWHTRLVTNPDFILREIGDECVLVPVVEDGPFQNTMLNMNETAAYLWRQFKKGATPAEVLEIARHEYEGEGGDPASIVEGVYRYVLESVSLDLLRPEEQA